MINLEDLKLPKEGPLEYQFRDEIIKRLSDFAYKMMIEYNKNLAVVDIPEFAKLPEDTIKNSNRYLDYKTYNRRQIVSSL